MPAYRIVRRPSQRGRTVVVASLLLGAASLVLVTAALSGIYAIEPAGCQLLNLLAVNCASMAVSIAPPADGRMAAIFGRVFVFSSAFVALFEIAMRIRLAAIIALLLAMHAWPLLLSVYWFRFHRRQPATSVPVRIQRATAYQVAMSFLGKLLVTGALIGSHDYTGREPAGWTAGDLGCRSPLVAAVTLVLGSVGSMPYLMFLGGRARGSTAPRASLRREDLAVLGQHLPKGRFLQGLSLLNLVIIGPVLEEIVYRGFFVYCLGDLIGSVGVAVVIGLALCLCLHLYQGRHLLHRHVAFYVVVVALLYSPLGLTGAIGFHVGCNFWYAASLRSLVRTRRSRPTIVIASR